MLSWLPSAQLGDCLVIGWLIPEKKTYDDAGDWIWDKLRFAPARGRTAPSKTPTCTDVISLDSVIYAAPPHANTRYRLCSQQEASAKSGHAGVFLTLIEFVQQQDERAKSGLERLDIGAVEAHLQLPHREADVMSDDEDEDEDNGEGSEGEGGEDS